MKRSPRTLLDPRALEARRRAASNELAPLAISLASDLEPLFERELFIPREKARMTRVGGRCAHDGTLLSFDPFAPRSHRCSLCGTVYDDDAHYRWWIMWYQLWLAERAVHGATLALLVDDDRGARLAESILLGYAERYLLYPNQDNVLGPTRPFFSTYLESIWLLQLCVALDLLEARRVARSLGATVRDRIIAPSRALIARYDEGGSNRQVWNAAALAAASRVLDDDASVERAVLGPHGVAWHIEQGLLADGTWFEGENYHQFAHRGLWYGVTLAERAGIELPRALVSRFDDGFVAPFLTALPDLTLPARRDSQWAISLRQWRYAESCELGMARRDDERLLGALSALYASDPQVPRRDTGRSRSCAESERNEPATALTRADLGWRSLLHARAVPPEARAWAPASVLLPAQGLAVFRRDEGRVYVALDCGTSGGGHGHPDRLNLLLADRSRRWLDDKGTGSYVERKLHWYRSTLAHDAPLVDGRSQRRVDGTLRAFDERDAWGWALASARIADGVEATRALVVTPDYIVERLTWNADRDVTLDLPMHVDAHLDGDDAWMPAELVGAGGLEDGFDFLQNVECIAHPAGATRWHAPNDAGPPLDVWVMQDGPVEWFRAVAPAAPGLGDARFVFSRRTGRTGTITSVWSVRERVADVRAEGRELVVILKDDVHRHAETADGWRVSRATDGAVLATLGGRRTPPPDSPALLLPPAASSTQAVEVPDDGAVVRFQLGEPHYRPSELEWGEAGEPTAHVSLAADERELRIEVEVAVAAPTFVAPSAENALDNERAQINGDSVQLHLRTAGHDDVAAWLVVPDMDDVGRAHVIPTTPVAATVPLGATATRTPRGYAVTLTLPRSGVFGVPGDDAAIDVIVNETAPGRERRRGQLLLSGRRGGFVYLQGDRQAREQLLPLRLVARQPRSASTDT